MYMYIYIEPPMHQWRQCSGEQAMEGPTQACVGAMEELSISRDIIDGANMGLGKKCFLVHSLSM